MRKIKSSSIHLPTDAELYFTGRNIVNRGNITHTCVNAAFKFFLKNESPGYLEKGVSGERCYQRKMKNYACFLWEVRKKNVS